MLIRITISSRTLNPFKYNNSKSIAKATACFLFCFLWVISLPAQESVLQEGIDLMEEEKYALAINSFYKIILEDSANYLAFYYRGICHARFYNHEKAIADFNEAISLNPQFPEAFAERAVSLGELGNYSAAIADFNSAIALDPDNINHLYNRGISKSQFGDFTGALEDFESIISLQPNDTVAIFHRGLCESALGRDKTALPDLELIHTTHRDPDADPRELAKFHFTHERFELAILFNTYAILADKDCSDCYLDRGLARGAFGDFGGAIADLAKVIGLNERSAHAFYWKGYYHILVKQRKAGCRDIRRSLDLGYSKADPQLMQFCK